MIKYSDIKEIKPEGKYSFCQFGKAVGISRTHFKRKIAEFGILPVGGKAHGSRPMFLGRDIIRFNTWYN